MPVGEGRKFKPKHDSTKNDNLLYQFTSLTSNKGKQIETEHHKTAAGEGEIQQNRKQMEAAEAKPNNIHHQSEPY